MTTQTLTSSSRSRLPVQLSSLALSLFLISTLSLGCSENRDPNTPDGSLRLFAQVLSKGDPEEIYASISTPSQKTLTELLALVKRLSSEVQRFPTEGAQKWAYAEVFKGPLQGIASLTNEQAILAHLIRDRLQWAQGQPIEELEQGLSSVKSISGSAESGEVRLLTRAQQQITMRLEKRPSGQVWTLAVFERGLTQYRDGLKDSLEVLEKNRAEWRRRMRLDLDLPKTP